MKTLQAENGQKFGTITSRESYTFFDALAVLQKKGCTLVDAKELSDLLGEPEFQELRSRRSNVATYVANGFVYTPSGEVLVVSRDKNPIVKRYEETLSRFNEFSFPDHPEYQKVLDEVAGKEHAATGTSSDALLRRRMILRPDEFLAPLRKIGEYAKSHGVAVVLPMSFNPRAYHPADKVKTRNGEPYFISRIKDVSRFCSGFGAREKLTERELADLVEVASSDVEKARESGVLLVQRDTIHEADPFADERKYWKNSKDEPYFSRISVSVNGMSEHPITAFLFGDNAGKFSEHLQQRGVRVLPLEIVDKSYVAKQEKVLIKPVMYNMDRPHVDAAGREGLYHAQVFGRK